LKRLLCIHPSFTINLRAQPSTSVHTMSSPAFAFVPVQVQTKLATGFLPTTVEHHYHSDGESSTSSMNEHRSHRSVSPCSSVGSFHSASPVKFVGHDACVPESPCQDEKCNQALGPQDDAIAALLMMSHIKPVVSQQPSRKRKEVSRSCPHCERTFDDASNFRAHLRTHTGEKPFVCEFPGCEHRFASSSNLIVHRRLHTGERPYACSSCPLSFVDSGALNKHRRVHTGEKPYACDHEGCTQAFARSGDLTVHKRVHTGEKPFECSTCHKSYTQRSSLKAHSKIHMLDAQFDMQL